MAASKQPAAQSGTFAANLEQSGVREEHDGALDDDASAGTELEMDPALLTLDDTGGGI